ncbi:MAG: hypothetical protein AAGA66_09950, partial [Bacteroidota bacterium]
VSKTPVKFAGRVGAGLVNSFSRLSPNIGTSLLFGGKANLELGYNLVIKPDLIKNPDTIYQFLVGFRYQNPSDGFLLRLFVAELYGTDFDETFSLIPYLGLSLGYVF